MYSEQLSRITKLEERIKELEELIQGMQKTIDTFEKDSIFLAALQECGVDNWSGYDEAQELVYTWENGY